MASEPKLATSQGWAVEADSVPKVGPDPVPGARPVVAARDHFRVVDQGDDGAATMVLYRAGAHIAQSHVDLPGVGAVFDESAGAYVPADPDANPRKAATTKVRLGR